jgi:iron(III) transport system permease protein
VARTGHSPPEMTAATRVLGGLRRRPAGVARPPAPLLLVVAAVAVAALVPLAYLGIRAIGSADSAVALLLRPRTLELVVSTAALGAGVGVGAVALGLPLAWLTARTDLPHRRAWSVLAMAPLAVPSYLLAYAFVAALGSRGWLAASLGPLGDIVTPYVTGFVGALVVLTLATTPYVVLAARAALVRLDPALEEAARSLGDRPLAAARAAVLPVLLPSLGAGALLAALYAISDFGAVSILRTDTLARAVHTQYRSSFDPGGAAILALSLVAIALLLVGLEQYVRRRSALRVPHGSIRTPRTQELGRWRMPALVFCAGVAFFSLGLPVVTVAVWLLRGLIEGIPVHLGLQPLVDTLVLAVSAALLALLVALPLAWVIVRYPGRWASRVEILLYGVYAIPGISLALAVVYFTLNVLPTLYQTLAALVLAVALRFLMQPVAALRGPLLQIGPATLEAARSLGESAAGATRTIVLPLVRPGAIAAAALVFLSAMKELPLTLLVAPTGFSTLATRLWDAAREGFFTQAALPAALLLIVSTASLAVLVRNEGVLR